MSSGRRLVMIDMGGVFFTYSFERAIRRWADLCGADPSSLRDRFAIDEAFDAFERGDVDPDFYVAHLRARLGHGLSVSQVEDGWNSIYGAVNHGVVELVRRHREQCSSTFVGVSNTNALHAVAWSALYRDHLPVLDAIHCSHELRCTKPTALFFDAIGRRHGVTREEMVLVDDIPVVVDAAAALGIRAHRYVDVAGLDTFLGGVRP